MFMQGMWLPESLDDMIWGFVREVRRYYSEVDMGPGGGPKQQQKWHEDIRSRQDELNEGMIHLANMIANLSWYKGNENSVEGVIDAFHLMHAGHMSPPVVLTCIKWLGADLNDAENCKKTIDRLVEMLNHHWSGWRRAESSEGLIPALEEANRLLPLNNELGKIVPLPYGTRSSDDD